MKTSFFLLIFAAVLLSACTATKPTPSAMPKAMDTATPEASSTPTVALTVTGQAPTETPEPTETVEIDLTKKAIDAQATKVAEFSVTCNSSNQEATAISPNGKWLAINCVREENATLEIVNHEGKYWVLNLKDYIAKRYIDENGIIGRGRLNVQYWSKDEEYLYFSSALYFSGGGICFYSFGAQGLYRIRLNDGTVSAILPANERAEYDFSFSPTKRRLAYISRENLIILDLQTGAETKIDFGNQSAGNLTWSPDGLELAYATCEISQDSENNYSIKKSAVKIFSIKKQASRTVVEMDKMMFFIQSWNSSNIMQILQSPYGFVNDGTIQFFDLNTNQWITPTPTSQN